MLIDAAKMRYKSKTKESVDTLLGDTVGLSPNTWDDPYGPYAGDLEDDDGEGEDFVSPEDRMRELDLEESFASRA